MGAVQQQLPLREYEKKNFLNDELLSFEIVPPWRNRSAKWLKICFIAVEKGLTFSPLHELLQLYQALPYCLAVLLPGS